MKCDHSASWLPGQPHVPAVLTPLRVCLDSSQPSTVFFPWSHLPWQHIWGFRALKNVLIQIINTLCLKHYILLGMNVLRLLWSSSKLDANCGLCGVLSLKTLCPWTWALGDFSGAQACSWSGHQWKGPKPWLPQSAWLSTTDSCEHCCHAFLAMLACLSDCKPK